MGIRGWRRRSKDVGEVVREPLQQCKRLANDIILLSGLRNGVLS